MIDVFRREAAGRSAERKYKALSKTWRRRVFGRRFAIYFWTIYIMLLLLVLSLDLAGRWAMYVGFGFGAAYAAWLLLPDSLMPGHIFNWQLGAWSEQNTASELRRLRHEGWVVRHDVKWGARSNHDHVVAGPAVYVLNTKNAKDSIVAIEGCVVRVTRLDDPSESYLSDRWLPSAGAEARTLKAKLDRELGFPVAVYPVVVVWGRFEAGQQYVGEVSLVAGDRLVEWLQSRPVDLLADEKRRRVGDWVRRLSRA